MTSLKRRAKESDDSLIEAIKQLERAGFGAGAATCQVCGTPLCEGECVAVYAFRPVSQLLYSVGYALCHEHWDEYSRVWTLGVREVVVRGRVGRVVDQARQSSCRVVLDPRPVAVSPPAEGAVTSKTRCASHVGGEA